MRLRRSFYALPSWLTTGEGERVLYSLGLLCDGYLQRLYEGVLARFPQFAPSDALSYLGRDRKITRGIGESDASFSARLVQWLDDHRVRGNPFALMRQLRAFCQADVRLRTVDRNGNWYTLERDGSTSVDLATGEWDWDGVSTDLWARFWVIIYPTADGRPWKQTQTWGESETIGTTATANEVSTVKSIIKAWKPAGTTCEWVIIAFDDASFDPATTVLAGDWENWGKLTGSVYGAARLTTARYWKVTHGPIQR